MDSVDRQIIELLRRNGRRSSVEIARLAGVSEGTIRKRMDRLISEGILAIHGLVNPRAVGFDLSIQLFAKVELARLQSVGRALAELPEVVSVHLVTGEYDLMAEVALRSNEELIAFLTERVASLPGVLSTTTAHVPMTIKHRHEWALPEPAPPSVLIADDDPDFVEVTRLLLESHGYEVRSAPSGQDALDALLRRPADLLILDIMMDGVLDGWDASRRVRSVSSLRRLPILVVSSITSSDYLQLVPTDDDNLISNFLSKPVDPDALLREVERLSKHA